MSTDPSPIIVSEAAWPEDESFLQSLKMSWVDQYAEYLGQSAAVSLVERLLISGELFPPAEQPLLVARCGEGFAGVASLRPLQGLSLITMLEVLEAYQHRGVGRALVEALGKHPERLLAHVSIHRPGVRIFYQRLGFTLLDRSVVDHFGHSLEFDVLVK